MDSDNFWSLVVPPYAWSLQDIFRMQFLFISSYGFLLFLFIFFLPSSRCFAPGGCFLISDAEAEAIEDPQATSGPKACDLGVTPGVAPSLRGSVVGISLSDGLPGAKAKAQMDRKNEKTLIAPASSPGPSDVNTFLLGLICVLSVAAAIGIIAGAAHFLLGKKKPKKSRSLKAAPEDEQPLERAPMPSTSSMSFVPSMPIQMSAPPTMAMPPTMQMSVPMAQPQPIQYYQPLQYDHYAQQFAGQAWRPNFPRLFLGCCLFLPLESAHTVRNICDRASFSKVSAQTFSSNHRRPTFISKLRKYKENEHRCITSYYCN